MLTDEELMDARLKFIEEYGLGRAVGQYISEVLAHNVPEDESRLVVYLSKKPPAHLRNTLPQLFMGAWIDCIVDD